VDFNFLTTDNQQLRIGYQQDIGKLLPEEVHLWLATIDHVPDLLLSTEEQDQLNTIKLPFAARRFESTRKLLRYLFSVYLSSSEFQIKKTDQGKPFLPAFPEFYFSVTHSKTMIMIALSRGPVGIDLERVRELPVIPIAQRFFSPQELFFLQDEKPQQNQKIFFKLWTAKEAALKADGAGIAFGMKNNVATMEEEKVTSIFYQQQSWNISSWDFREGNESFFGAIATLFIPTVIHWYDLRMFDKVSA
jgi:4'-phosphopantetheinyl transferase